MLSAAARLSSTMTTRNPSRGKFAVAMCVPSLGRPAGQDMAGLEGRREPGGVPDMAVESETDVIPSPPTQRESEGGPPWRTGQSVHDRCRSPGRTDPLLKGRQEIA